MRALRPLVLGLVLVAGAAPAARAADAPTLGAAVGATFPDRSYALTLPRAVTLSPADVELRENGHAVPGVVVQPADGVAGRRFGVVLAIDTSGSMRGRPLRGAIVAAREFVAHRAALQPVAIVTFAGNVQVALPFTTDGAAIERALAAVRPAPGGSRVLDAAVRASELVREAKLQSGSVVLLSDGSDHGSHRSLGDVGATSAATGVRVYTVGLRSARPNFGMLNLIAATTHGEFSATSSVRDLARIYARLGSLLAHQYVIRYRSPAAPGAHVRVEARVTGFAGVASAVYVAPAAPLGHAAPYHRAPADTLWLRPGAAVGVSVACAVLLLLALWIALRPRAGSLRSRVAAYVNPADPEPERPRRAEPGRASRFGLTQSMRGSGFRDRLRERLDVGRIAVPPERLIGWTAGTTLLLLVMLPLLTGAGVTVVLALAVPIGVRAYVEQCVRRQRRLFTEQLPDNLQVMASAMRAGHSFAGALTVVADDAPEPTRREFQRVIADERLGVPVDEALAGVVRRMESKDLEQVALVAALQRETGGNTAEVLERVTDTVRERVAVRRMIKGLTAQGRMSRWVLTAIPIALLAAFTVINPVYVRPLYVEPLGQALLVLGGVMVTSGSLVIKRIVDIKV